MKRILKYFIFVLVIACCSMIGVNAENVCTYEKDLTISFDDAGSVTINENFWPKRNEKFRLLSEKIFEDTTVANQDLQNQLTDLSGLCPSKIYYCKVSTESLDIMGGTLDKIKNMVTDGVTIENILSILKSAFLHHKIELAVYLSGSESELKSKYGISGSKDEALGLDVIDAIMDVKNGEYTVLEAIVVITEAFLTESGWLTGINYKKQECGYVEYTGDKPTYNLACSATSTYIKDYIDKIASFKTCSGDAYCKSKELGKMTRLESRIKKYCSNILENYNYEEGSTEADCIDQCITISELINTMKDNAGINKGTVGACGFSARLLVWGRNIVKWVKYIIPVILIVLGILDFIRAITKDKEEEMKKAQDKFIKRLIAAALIFIIPFIIGFVLDKMGFSDYIDGCDVIEELNDY